MMEDARRHKFDVLMVWSCERSMNFRDSEFSSSRSARRLTPRDRPAGPSSSSFPRWRSWSGCIIIERVRAGMRRAKLEGRRIGRSRLDVDREQVVRDRRSGMSLTQVAKRHSISRASVCRLMKEASSDCSLATAISNENHGLETRL